MLARIDEAFPLVGPRCGGEMRIIAFITDAGAVRSKHDFVNAALRCADFLG